MILFYDDDRLLWHYWVEMLCIIQFLDAEVSKFVGRMPRISYREGGALDSRMPPTNRVDCHHRRRERPMFAGVLLESYAMPYMSILTLSPALSSAYFIRSMRLASPFDHSIFPMK